jgi:uncharacterized membrane protein
MDKAGKNMTFKEFSSLRQRKISAQQPDASSNGSKGTAAAQTDQANHAQIPRQNETKGQWTQSRGYAQISVAFVCLDVVGWAVLQMMPRLFRGSELDAGAAAVIFSSLHTLRWTTTSIAVLDAFVSIAFHTANLRLAGFWDAICMLLAGLQLATAIFFGTTAAGPVGVLRLIKLITLLRTIDKEHDAEIAHISDRLQASTSAEKICPESVEPSQHKMAA